MLIADGSPIEREGLKLIASAAMPLIAIDTAESVAEAERLAGLHRYQLAILDMALPGSRGFSCFLQLQHRLDHVPIILLAAEWTAALVESARVLGAAGLLAKTAALDAVADAMRRAFEGGTSFPPVTAPVDPVHRARRAIHNLSGAQLRVLTALAGGRSNKQIAGDLGVTEATIKAHLSATFRKLGVQNRAQALLAMQPLFSEPLHAEN